MIYTVFLEGKKTARKPFLCEECHRRLFDYYNERYIIRAMTIAIEDTKDRTVTEKSCLRCKTLYRVL